jgi:hypothetical protein
MLMADSAILIFSTGLWNKLFIKSNIRSSTLILLAILFFFCDQKDIYRYFRCINPNLFGKVLYLLGE